MRSALAAAALLLIFLASAAGARAETANASRRDRQTPGIRSPCCARAASGYAAAAPASSDMNSRRLMLISPLR
jgi:hypothetical protein